MRALVVLFALGTSLVLGPAALGVDPDHRAAEGQARVKVVDQTLACTTLVQAGIRKVTVRAASTVPAQRDPQGRKVFPFAGLDTGGWQSSAGGNSPIVGGATLVSGSTGPSRSERGAYFILSRKQCKATSRRVALSPTGLHGGRASPFGDAYECFPGRTILVRARALFRTATRLRLDRINGRLVTEAALREVSFAARTLSGKPLVYAEASDSGKARLFVGQGCVRD
jgi:hypothetical protein